MTATATAEDLAPGTADPVQPPGDDHRISRRRWLVAYVLVLAVIAAAIIGGRVAMNRTADRPEAVSVAHPAAPFPANPAVEAQWGMRFTNVMVLAANGGVELRYQVTDDAKAAKIHQVAQTSNQLPSLEVERTGSTIAPSAVLMHFHHGDATAGRTYSIIYGNAGSSVRLGDLITISMTDHLRLAHVRVTD